MIAKLKKKQKLMLLDNLYRMRYEKAYPKKEM